MLAADCLLGVAPGSGFVRAALEDAQPFVTKARERGIEGRVTAVLPTGRAYLFLLCTLVVCWLALNPLAIPEDAITEAEFEEGSR